MKKLLLFILSLLSTSFLNSQEINWSFELKDSSFGQTAAGDIDGDGKLELVFGCYRNDGNIYALNSEDGSLLWKYNTSVGGGDACNDVAPVIYDVDNDGKLDVIVPSSCTALTYCLNGADGKIKWTAATRGSDSPPTIADIDGDGKYEVLHGEFGGWVICLNIEDGSRKWEIPVDMNSWIQTAPTIIDLDGDSKLDFVVATWNAVEGDTNRVYAYRGFDHKLLWSFDLSAVTYHGTAVADLDGDKKPELIIGDYNGSVYAINAEDGSLHWEFKDEVPIYIGSPVTIGDIDGDGDCDLVFTDANKVIAINKKGKFMWRFNMGAGQAFRGVAMSDITNDGILDVTFATMDGHAIGLKGIDGSKLFDHNFQEKYGKVLDFNHGPIIADFDQNDTLDMFIIGGNTDFPDYSKNYGIAISFPIGKGKGPDWLMFQKNIHRTSSFCDSPVSVDDSKIQSLRSIVYPNPFSEKICITTKLTSEKILQIRIIDILGNLVKELNYSENLNSEKCWDGTNSSGREMAPGYYFAEIKCMNYSEVVKLLKSK
jgi:outer membrane protein assembly factor BamB